MEDQRNLVTAVKTITENHWTERNSPVLLSALPQLLEGEAPDFRAVLGSRTLKAFIKETGESAGYKLVEHPTQRARVGVAPTAAEYKFPSEPAPPHDDFRKKQPRGDACVFSRAG